MPIKTLQQRLTQVGVIRLGQQLISKSSGKPYPSKLETLRFTSASRQLIDAAADLYGGEVKPWQSNTGPQFEVVSSVNEVRVLVPPQRIDPNLEHWGNGYRDRLCDGEMEAISGKPCVCAAAIAAKKPLGPRNECKPTTRMSLMLADIPSLGTWKIESHGWNAAAELPMLAESIEKAPEPIPARLVVETREKNLFHPDRPEKDRIEARVFMVPVLHFDWITPAQAFGGELGTAARAALGASTEQRHAIEAAKVESTRRKLTPAQYITLGEVAESVSEARELWNEAKEDGALTDEVKAALNKRVADIEAEQANRQAPAKPETPATPPPPQDDVVDAEVAPDPDAVWTQILAAGGMRGWDTDVLEQKVVEFLKRPSNKADGFELTRFLKAVEAGEVA